MRKEKLADSALREAVRRVESRPIDAVLGGGVIKQRVARPGKVKSDGYRTLILFRQGDRAIIGFAKSAQANKSKADLALLKNGAAGALGWSGEELDRLVVSGR